MERYLVLKKKKKKIKKKEEKWKLYRTVEIHMTDTAIHTYMIQILAHAPHLTKKHLFKIYYTHAHKHLSVHNTQRAYTKKKNS